MNSLSTQPEHSPAPEKETLSKPRSARDVLATHEKREHELWRLSLLLLFLLAVAVGAQTWEKVQSLHIQLQLLPAGIVLLILLLVVLVWQKKREVDRLRATVHMVRDSRSADNDPASDEYSERLLEIVRRSQRGYRDLIDSFDEAVFALSLDGVILAANRRFAEVMQEGFSQIVGRRLDDFLSEPERAAVEEGLPRFLVRRHWGGVVRVRIRKTAKVLFFDCIVHPIVRHGEVDGASCLARDVTQERESEARFAELFETLQEGIYFSTPEGRFLDVNPALVRMLGYSSKEELLAVKTEDIYQDSGDRSALIRELEEHGRLRSREVALRRRDGAAVLCLDSCTVTRDVSGKSARYQGTLVDITSRREMEIKLHQEREFAQRLIDSFPDLIVVLDTQGLYTFVSDRIRETLGYTPEEMVGTGLGDRTAPEHREVLRAMFQDLISGRKTLGSVEYRTLHKDGTWRLLRAVACPIKDPEGRITGIIASARDVTELNRLEQQVLQTEKLAAMGQMIAGVAHELNNPLTAILSVSDMLRERTEEPGARRQLELIHQQSRRAADIVQDLLSFSRPPAPHRGRVRLGEVVRRALNLHDYSLRRNNVAVDLVPELGIPDVVGDSSQLIQVFLNLVVNAEQAIREVREKGTLRVRLGCGLPGESRVWASVEDDGPGIPPDILPKVFDPFFTTKRPGRGTGLGLSICMAIVREHGGDIEVRPAAGGGTVFTISLPAAPELDRASLILPDSSPTTA